VARLQVRRTLVRTRELRDRMNVRLSVMAIALALQLDEVDDYGFLLTVFSPDQSNNLSDIEPVPLSIVDVLNVRELRVQVNRRESRPYSFPRRHPR
jgi:hypothetical protein